MRRMLASCRPNTPLSPKLADNLVGQGLLLCSLLVGQGGLVVVDPMNIRKP